MTYPSRGDAARFTSALTAMRDWCLWTLTRLEDAGRQWCLEGSTPIAECAAVCTSPADTILSDEIADANFDAFPSDQQVLFTSSFL